MKKLILFTFIASILLAGCSSAPEATTTQADDHHAGEENVMPHDDMPMKAMDDHHAGETDVPPHDDEAEPHDDSGKPPHRH